MERISIRRVPWMLLAAAGAMLISQVSALGQNTQQSDATGAFGAANAPQVSVSPGFLGTAAGTFYSAQPGLVTQVTGLEADITGLQAPNALAGLPAADAAAIQQQLAAQQQALQDLQAALQQLAGNGQRTLDIPTFNRVLRDLKRLRQRMFTLLREAEAIPENGTPEQQAARSHLLSIVARELDLLEAVIPPVERLRTAIQGAR